MNGTRFLLPLVCLLLTSSRVCAAEDQIVLRFVENPRASRNVVELGDLVEVLSGESSSVTRMLKIPLGPAPREDTAQTWHSEDILQHLEFSGFHPNSLRWSGNTQVKLQRMAGVNLAMTESIQPAFVQPRTIELAENLVAQAIKGYLDLKTGERTDWLVKPNVPAELANVIRIKRNIVGIGGGQEPWHGRQEFVLQIQDRNQLSNVKVVAIVDLPPMVVVAKRPLRRDEVIAAEVLEYAPLPAQTAVEQEKLYTDFEQLIGKQLKRSVSTGLPISSDFVGAPIVIQRNEMIEVESVAGQVVVRAMARSLGSGAVGELIEIETIPAKHRMLATVAGPLKVRVAAMSARSSQER